MDLQTGITRDIYPMPAFVTLTVADVRRTVDWYVEALGFVPLFTMPGPDGEPALVHLRRWRYQDLLVRPGTPQAATGAVVSVSALAEELAGIAEQARAFASRDGGGSVEGPVETPWNTVDVRTTDPDGYPLVFTARRPEARRDAAFEQRITELASDQLGDRG
jgi:catechol 2,3-dioxygenase-like lactoylglutathione lyase family enzyme